MPKFTYTERTQIKDIVATLSLKRISDEQIIEFIVGRFNKTISGRNLRSYKQQIKKDSYRWYSMMRENRYEYIAAYKERINEIIALQEMHHEIILRNRNSPQICQTSLAELHRLNITYSNYIEILPYVINNNGNGSTISTPSSEVKTVPKSGTESESVIIV